MKQVLILYTGLLIIGLLATLLYGLIWLGVSRLNEADIDIAGMISIENTAAVRGPTVVPSKLLLARLMPDVGHEPVPARYPWLEATPLPQP
jgi:hypothetical protein